ncbi:MAG: DUF1080 domain-containing protein [Bacteroidia bacterium]
MIKIIQSGLMVLIALTIMNTAVSAKDKKKNDKVHPDSENWESLFKDDLSNASFPKGIWTFKKGVLTASEDQAIWSAKDYKNFKIDLEFQTASGTNSGVIVYCTNKENWIPNSVEIQIADDYAKQWAESPKTWQCAAIFGHLAPKESKVKKPGEWNRLTISCKGKKIKVALNEKVVTEMDMDLWTSASKNPDGSEIPTWLSTPFNKLPTHGYIGLQGKHAGAPIYFRNIKIKELKDKEEKK